MVIKLLFFSCAHTLHTQLSDAGAGMSLTTFLLCQPPAHEVLSVGTREQVQGTGGKERDFPFLLARCLCWCCRSIDPSPWAAAIASSSQPLCHSQKQPWQHCQSQLAGIPPSGSGPATWGSSCRFLMILALQCLLLRVLGSRSVGSFLQTPSSDNPTSWSLELRSISYFFQLLSLSISVLLVCFSLVF